MTTQPNPASIWDSPDMLAGGDYIRFDNVGDSVSGTLTAIRPHRFNPDEPAVPAVPQLLLTTDDGEEKTVTAGQVLLKAALAEQRPEAGDHIAITLSDIEKRSGGKTLKHWSVTVTRGGAPAATQPAATQPAAAAPAAPQQTVDPAAAAAALANLTPEQKAALGIAT